MEKEIEKLKSYYVSMVDMDKIDKDMNITFDKIEGLKESMGNIFKVIETLEPQQKLFFLDKVIMDIILKSQMPVFYLNGLLVKMSEYIKSIDGNNFTQPEPSEYRPDYLG